MQLKAPLVLHILDQRMTKLGTTLALSRNVIPEILRQARADSLTGRQLSTEHFFRICKKSTRSLDVIAFQNQWVLGSGCPRFAVRAEYVKKGGRQGYVSLSVYQPPSQAFRVVGDKEVNNLEWKAPTEYFTGDLTVHIHDGDEAPFEHVVDVIGEGRIHELPYTANTKRVYRNRSSRRTGRLKAEETQNEATTSEKEMSEDKREAIEWKFANWAQDDMEKLFSQGFDWVRYDPDGEWIAMFDRQKTAVGGVPVESDAIVWATQLQYEKDVIAQKEVSRAVIPADWRFAQK
jgi:transcription initiation factor TFIID subunit 2